MRMSVGDLFNFTGSPKVNVIHVNICVMVVVIEFYPFTIPFFVTLTPFQGHSGIRRLIKTVFLATYYI